MRIKTPTERLDAQVHPDVKCDIQLEASLRQVAVSNHARTAVPSEFFNELYASLDEPTTLEAPLARAVAEARARVAHR
jgi:hypothetical protein